MDDTRGVTCLDLEDVEVLGILDALELLTRQGVLPEDVPDEAPDNLLAIGARVQSGLVRWRDEGQGILDQRSVGYRLAEGVVGQLITVARQGLALKSVTWLLDAGPKLDAANRHKETALHFAAQDGNLRLVELLLARGAKPNVGLKDKNYGLAGVPTYTPLYNAAAHGHTECALALLSAGANPNTGTATSWVQNPLGMAVKRGDVRLCRALLAAGARFSGAVLSADLRAKLRALVGDPASVERLLRMCVKRMNGIPNAISASGPTPETPPRFELFAQVARELRSLQRAGVLMATERNLVLVGSPTTPPAKLDFVREALGLAKEARTLRLTHRCGMGL